VLGEVSAEILGSRRVVPQLAESLGFPFRAPTLEQALEAEL
jgi:NAD dependent epimerase/dehydratase family enzyme